MNRRGSASQSTVPRLARAASIGAATAVAAFSGAALAQNAPTVVTQAEDAFGARIGIEQIGLYSEGQVRGFNLQEAGNYRIEGAYFVRSAALNDTVNGGVTIRVGVNALGADFPSPSGAVDYRLRTAAPGRRVTIETGLRDYGTPFISLTGSAATADGVIGAAGGLEYVDGQFADGGRFRAYRAGIAPQWRPNAMLTVGGVLSYSRFVYPGDYVFTMSGAALSPRAELPKRYTSTWSGADVQDVVAGFVARAMPTPDWTVRLSSFYSEGTAPRRDFTQIRLGAYGLGSATGFQSRPAATASFSHALEASRRLGAGQRVFGTVQLRDTEALRRPSVAVDLGAFDIEEGMRVTPAPSEPPALAPTRDHVQQLTFGVGYELDLAQRLRLKGGVMRTRYDKSVASPGEPVQSERATPWLFGASAIYALSENWTLFSTAARGLEESGIAPANAANRNEVLPAVVVNQYELGIRGRLTPDLSLIGSLFEIAKPTPGLDDGNVYRLLGEVRHRGAEISLTGELRDGLNLVAGAVWIDARRSGELVDRGVVAERAVGVPPVIAIASFNYRLPGVSGLSIDGQASYQGGRLARAQGGLETRPHTIVDFGARYQFEHAGRDFILRLRAGNIFDENEWVVNRAEGFFRTGRRTVRATLTAAF